MAIGPSTTTTPYIIPVAPGVQLTSILTTGDAVNGYKMVGLPDGLGAYDNGDGTFTVLMNHEIASTSGAVRAHGGKGAFVSAWVINKSDLKVVSGGDLIQKVYNWDTTTQKSSTTTSVVNFSRFCSADLPEVSAYYNATTGLGTTARLFMNGEEGGATGYQLGIVATGANKGNTYILGEFNLSTNGSADSVNSTVKLNVLTASTSSTSVTVSAVPRELAVGAKLLGQTVTAINTTTLTVTLSGNANATITTATPTDFTLAGVGGWENALANPFSQDKTIVIGNNDGGTGIMSQSVAVYVGTKTNTGSDADKAGLTNGTTKFINVTGSPAEIINSTTRATNITSGATFTLSSTSSTAFSRPEDGAWNPLNPNQYFFVTTDQIDQVRDGIGTQVGRSRLWRLNFTDITNPDAGGTIDMLLDGTEGQNMLDNITVDKFGHITLLEDTGGSAHNAKIWQYDIATDSLTQIAKTDTARFGDIVNGVVVPAAAGFTLDEETSGVIDLQDILGVGKQLIVVQDHTASADTTLVEGGQLLIIDTPITANATASLVSGSSSDDNLTSSVTTGFDGVNDIIFTGAGNDQIDSTLNSASANVLAGGNRVDAGSGNDTVTVANNDRSFGGDGNDEFFAQAVKGFRLSGGAGDDKFHLGASTGGRALGGDGNDTFFASSGGGNLLSGGAGADIFNIFTGDVLSSANTILDFQSGTDKIQIGGGITSIAGLDLTSGSNIIIKSTGATIATLTGVTASNLTATDFIFA
ncbi:MAG: hypothetical protein WCP16_02840 [Pseudanabaena sp. ELA645]